MNDIDEVNENAGRDVQVDAPAHFFIYKALDATLHVVLVPTTQSPLHNRRYPSTIIALIFHILRQLRVLLFQVLDPLVKVDVDLIVNFGHINGLLDLVGTTLYLTQ